MYGWTPQEIADMTPAQQYEYMMGDDTIRFDTLEEYQAWRTQNGPG